MVVSDSPWPMIPLVAWEDTRATLHAWLQLVGKIRMALAPPVNHWWHTTLAVSTRGLTTLAVPYDGGTIEIAFDFVAHQLIVDLADGRRQTIALRPVTVADFYAELMQLLSDLGVVVHVWPMPVEIPSPIRFDLDREHRSYDAGSVERWWRALLQVHSVFSEFRGRFLGKSSPVHFFWGSFDLAVTRFSGRRAPERDGADAVMREAYSHEVTSVGFWPGSGAIQAPAFYAYAAPEPAGFKTAVVGPRAAFYSADFNEFILRYDDVRTASSPRAALMEFLESTYEAGATLGGWNRTELERR